MSDSASTSNDFPCPECGTTVSVPDDEKRAKAWCETCEREVLTPWAVTAPSTELAEDDGYELAEGFDQPEAKVYIPIECRVCGTRMYGTEDQVGQDIPCPDCFAENRVPPPSAEDRKQSVPENLGPDLEIGERVSRPTLKQIGLSHLFEEDESEAEIQSSSAPGKQPVTDDEAPTLTKWFMFSRVFTFPFYPSVIAWWLGISIGTSFIMLMIEGVDKLSDMGPLAVMSVFLTLFSAVGGSFLAAMLFSCCLDILQASADGLDAPYGSEGGHMVDRFLEAVFVLVSLVYSLLPGWVVGFALRLAGLPDFWPEPLSAFILFPIFLLSTLEVGSAVVPYSKPILRTMRHCWRVWLLFYLEAAVVVVVPHAILEALGRRIFDNPFLGPLLLIAQVIIYFRLLGRVAWYGSEKLTDLDEQAEAAEELEEESPLQEQPVEADQSVASDQSE